MPGRLKFAVAMIAVVYAHPLHAQSLQEAQARSPEARARMVARLLDLKTGPMAKVGPTLALLHEEYEAYLQQGTRGPFRPGDPTARVIGDRVVIDAVAATTAAALLADLQALGLGNGATAGRMVSGTLPISALDELAARDTLRFAQPAVFKTHALTADEVVAFDARGAAPPTRAGSVTSEGDAAMQADDARAQFGVDGTGVTVGAISDSYDCLGGAAAGVASGDLPAGVTVLDDAFCPATDEGRALLEIIHDVAPGASGAFHTGNGGQANMATGITELATATPRGPGFPGATVIVDDVLYFAEPMFQDGIIAQAAEAAVASGVAVFSAAGNAASQSYESHFHGSGVAGASGDRHDFDPGPGVDDLQTIMLGPGTTFFSFQWAEPFFSVSGAPGAATDMDIVLYDPSGAPLGIGGFTANIGGDPVEVFSVTNGGASPVPVQLGLEHKAGVVPSLMKYVYFLATTTVEEFATNSPTIYGHAGAAGVVAVGAVFFGETPEFGGSGAVEPFTSRGPTRIFFDTDGTPTGIKSSVLQAPEDGPDRIQRTRGPTAPETRFKPEITAPDGTNNTFFGIDIDDLFEPPDDTDPNFFGTSASALHAAGVAALMQDLGSLTPSGLEQIIEQSTFDLDLPDIDDLSGFGLIDALNAAEIIFPCALDPTACFIDDLDIEGQPNTGTIDPRKFARGTGFTPVNNLTVGGSNFDSVSGLADELIFADGFESGDTSAWSNRGAPDGPRARP